MSSNQRGMENSTPMASTGAGLSEQATPTTSGIPNYYRFVPAKSPRADNTRSQPVRPPSRSGPGSSFEAAKAALLSFSIQPPEDQPKVEQVVFERPCLLPYSREMGPTGDSEEANRKKFTFNSKIPKHQEQKATGNDKRWKIDDFQVGRRLGEGRFGQVYSARDNKSGVTVALKVLSKNQIIHDDNFGKVKREVEIQTHLKHPNTLYMYGYFQDNTRLYMVLEYAPAGDLLQIMNKLPNNCFDEPMTARLITQLTNALIYCHSKNVIHRDIKLENLMLGADHSLKIGDFGCAVSAVHDLPTPKREVIGTLGYLSPEMLSGQTYDEKVDIWNVGLVFYEFLVGKLPFHSEDQNVTYMNILQAPILFPDRVSMGAQDLVKRLLMRTPRNRLPLKSIKNHPWMKSALKEESSVVFEGPGSA